MTFRSLTLSALLMLCLIGSAFSGVRCGNVAGKFVCYDVSREEIVALIERYAKELGVDPKLALEVAKKESKLDPFAVSPRGAIGVMQLMPETAQLLGVDPWDIEENIKGGLTYLKYLLDRFGKLDLALAAYNAGPGAVERYRGVPPYRETKRFVKKIKENYTEASSSAIRILKLPDGTVLITNLPPELVR